MQQKERLSSPDCQKLLKLAVTSNQLPDGCKIQLAKNNYHFLMFIKNIAFGLYDSVLILQFIGLVFSTLFVTVLLLLLVE